MSAQQPEATTLNDSLAIRGTVFAAPWCADLLAQVYGTRLVPLGVDGAPAFAHVRTLGLRKRVMLAPFNFQPALRDQGEAVARALVSVAEPIGASMHLQSHHALADACVSQLGLGAVSDSVESLVDLTGSYGAMLARARPRRRTQLRKSQDDCRAQGVTIDVAQGAGDLDDFFRIMQRAYRDKHRMITQPSALFTKLLAHPEAARIYLARDGARVALGGIFVLTDETQWLYGWGANTPAGEKLGLGAVLIARAMEDAAESVSLFSLGSSPRSHETLRQFKRSWGAEEHALHSYHWREAARAVDYHEGMPLARAVIAHLPLPVLSLASNVAVRLLV